LEWAIVSVKGTVDEVPWLSVSTTERAKDDLALKLKGGSGEDAERIPAEETLKAGTILPDTATSLAASQNEAPPYGDQSDADRLAMVAPAETLFGKLKAAVKRRGAMRVIVTRAVAFAKSDGVHDESLTESDKLKETGELGAQGHERL